MSQQCFHLCRNVLSSSLSKWKQSLIIDSCFCVSLITLNQRQITFQVLTIMGQERRKYKYRSSHLEVLVKIAIRKNMTKFLKNSGERAQFLVNLQATGDKISVPILASLSALRAKERRTQYNETRKLTILG